MTDVPDPPLGVTVCILATWNPDGTCTMQYHGPVSETQAELIRAFAGPLVAEQLLSADDVAAVALGPQGVMVVATGGEELGLSLSSDDSAAMRERIQRRKDERRRNGEAEEMRS